jgi:hypothetical protein
MIQEDYICILKETEARSKSNTDRISKLEGRQDNLDKLVTTVGILANKQNNIEDDVKEIKADVKCLTEKPGKRWDSVVQSVILLVVGAFVGYLLMRLGLS